MSDEELRPFGWAPGKYMLVRCANPNCQTPLRDLHNPNAWAAKRASRCKPCAEEAYAKAKCLGVFAKTAEGPFHEHNAQVDAYLRERLILMGWCPPEGDDRRVSELLAYNSREVNLRRLQNRLLVRAAEVRDLLRRLGKARCSIKNIDIGAIEQRLAEALERYDALATVMPADQHDLRIPELLEKFT